MKGEGRKQQYAEGQVEGAMVRTKKAGEREEVKKDRSKNCRNNKQAIDFSQFMNGKEV